MTKVETRNIETENIQEEVLISDDMSTSLGLDSELFFRGFILDFIKTTHGKEILQSDEYQELALQKILTLLQKNNIFRVDILKVDIFSNGKLKIYTEKEDGTQQTFEIPNILSKQDITEQKQKEQQERVERAKNLREHLESADKLLSAMEYIFEKKKKIEVKTLHTRAGIKKKTEISYDYIDDQDIIDTDQFGANMKGKKLRDLQLVFRQKLIEINSFGDVVGTEQKVLLLEQQKAYFKMFMGIGEKYEGGSHFLVETGDGAEFVSLSILAESSNTEILDYLEDIYKEIYKNDTTSQSVKSSYDFIKNSFTEMVFAKLLSKDATNEEFLRLAQIISGRDEKGEKSFYGDFSNVELANTILGHIFLKNNVTEKGLQEHGLSYEDEKIQNEKPSQIVGNFQKVFVETYGEEIEQNPEIKETPDEYFQKFLQDGYSEVLDLGDTKYEDLTFLQKTRLGVLARMTEKVKRVPKILKRTKIRKQRLQEKVKKERKLWEEHYGGKLDKNKETAFYQYINRGYGLYQDRLDSYFKVGTLAGFQELFNKISVSHTKKVISDFESNLDSANPFNKKFWLGTNPDNIVDFDNTQKQSLALFQDLKGTGFFDLSDASIDFVKGAGKFGIVLAAGIIAPQIILPSAGIFMQGVVGSGIGTYAYRHLFPEGYDSKEQENMDRLTDYGVNMLFGGLGAKASEKLLKGGLELTRGVRTKSLGAGLLVSGVPEFGRNIYMTQKFNNPIFMQSEEKLLELYNENKK